MTQTQKTNKEANKQHIVELSRINKDKFINRVENEPLDIIFGFKSFEALKDLKPPFILCIKCGNIDYIGDVISVVPELSIIRIINLKLKP